MRLGGLTLIALLLAVFTLKGQIRSTESFETGFGIWQQGTGDDLDWIRWSGPTPTLYTGPDTAYDGTYYIYIEADSNNYNPAKGADLIGQFDFSTAQMPILSFYYYMYGATVNYLAIYVSTDSVNWTEIDKIIGDQGPQWLRGIYCLGDYAGQDTVYIRFTAYTSGATTTDANECDIALDYIQVYDFYLVDSSHTDVTCAGYSDGSIYVAIGGGFAPFEYSIDGGVNYTSPINDTTYTFTGLYGSVYWLKVRSAQTCELDLGFVEVKEPPMPTITVDTQYVKPCEYSKNGVITVVAKGVAPPYTYSINGLAGPFTTDTLYQNLDTGLYHVVVKDSAGCIFDQGNVHIAALYEIKTLGYDKQDVTTCYGDNTGSITLYATGGSQPLSFSIDSGKTYTQNNYFASLYAGDYLGLVQDVNGCIDTFGLITITQPPKVVINSITKYDVTGCYGDSTGIIVINASGGSGPLSYSINGGITYYPTNTFDSLPAGNYYVYVRDTNQCTAGPDTVVINQPPQLIITAVNKTDVERCYGDSTGTIEIIATGGTPSIFYSIDGGQTYSLLNYFDSLPAGVYKPLVKDAAGCIATYPDITILQPTELLIGSITKLDVQGCYGDSTGEISIYAIGGTPPYYYSIDSGNTFQYNNNRFTGLGAGVYFVTVKDTMGCQKWWQDSIVITQPDSIVITSEQATDVRCNGENSGTITVTAQGGTGILLYSIDSALTFPYEVGTTINVYAGTYHIAVRDQNGCVKYGSTLVVNEPPKLLIDTVYVQDVQTCYGDSTGAIAISAVGGVKPYLYSIDYGATYQPDSLFDSLPSATNYYPYVKDANGCIYGYGQVSIAQPTPVTINQVFYTNVDTCHGVPAGTIEIWVSGGTPPYYYSIDSGQTFWLNKNYFDSLYGDRYYYVAVKDTHNCTKYYPAAIYISQPDTLILDSLVVKDVSCNGYQDGAVYIYARGGQPQLTYYLNDSLMSIVPYYQTLAPGNYTLRIQDAYRCTIDTSFVIDEPPPLVLDTVIYTDVTTCYGDNSAMIAIGAYGGSPPIYYSYVKIGIYTSPFVTDSLFTGLTSGAYYVRIQDANGCYRTSETFYIDQPSKVILRDYGYEPIVCHNDSTGLIWMYVTGGQGVYWYSIDGGQTWSQDSVFKNLGPGTYQVVVKDTNNCLADFQPVVNLTNPPLLVVDTVFVDDVSCYGYTDGHLQTVVSGGVSPYQYSLDTVNWQDDANFYGLEPGNYVVYVRDKNGCMTQSDTAVVNEPPNYALFEMSVSEGCPPLTVKFTPIEAVSTYKWDFGDGSDLVYQVSPTHTFVNVSSTSYAYFPITSIALHGGCADTARDTVIVYPKPNIQVLIDSTVNYYPDTIVGIYNMSLEYEDYTWDYGDGVVEKIVQPLQHAYPGCGTYLLQVSAKNYLGCYDTLRQTIIITAVDPKASFFTDVTDGCAPLTVNFYNTSSNAYKYLWEFGDGDTSTLANPTHTFTEGINYYVKLTAYGYCGKQDEYARVIYVYPTPKVDFDVEPDTVGVGQVVSFLNKSEGAIYYLWDFGDGNTSTEENPRYAYSTAGVFDVTLIARSENGCVDSLTKDSAVYVAGELLVQFPTAFTPNGDGVNDYFVPLMNLVEQAKLYIYDRYGNLVWYTDNAKEVYWDGRDINGRPLPQDVYVWRVIVTFINGQKIVKVGEVTLLR